MARVVKLKPAGKTVEIAKENNETLTKKLIPFGYPLREKFRGYDEALELPIELESYQLEKLINQ